MRVVVPDFENEFQINQAGVGIINLLTHDLFDFIDSGLTKLLGPTWLNEMLAEESNSTELNFRDPSILLKDLGRKTHASLRLPINQKVTKDEVYDFYNQLSDIHGERHLWVHQEIKATKKQLIYLVQMINRVATILELPVKTECEYLLTDAQGEVAVTKYSADSQEAFKEKSELVSAIQNLTKDDVSQVGTAIAGPYLEHSYTLYLNGEIKDREAGTLLSASRNNASLIGALLLARKPSGGRIRVTKEGVLAAYFEDHWGFLAQVEPENWFEGHI